MYGGIAPLYGGIALLYGGIAPLFNDFLGETPPYSGSSKGSLGGGLPTRLIPCLPRVEVLVGIRNAEEVEVVVAVAVVVVEVVVMVDISHSTLFPPVMLFAKLRLSSVVDIMGEPLVPIDIMGEAVAPKATERFLSLKGAVGMAGRGFG